MACSCSAVAGRWHIPTAENGRPELLHQKPGRMTLELMGALRHQMLNTSNASMHDVKLTCGVSTRIAKGEGNTPRIR
jgi:hypothetical protein